MHGDIGEPSNGERAMPIGTRAGAGHWQDWANLVLGGWLFIAPWVLGYAFVPAAAWNSWIIGAVVAVISVAALIRFTQWEEVVNAALGVWLLISPWLLGFAQSGPAPVWNHVILGLVIGGLAAWEAYSSRRTQVTA
jgi:hypothetical protein